MTTGTPQTRWDPQQYLQYADERTRPLHDLLARVPDPPAGPPGRPLRILDIGCGPGNSTAVVHRRWPDAHTTGIDNSTEMLAAARASGTGRGEASTVDYLPADAGSYDPLPEQPDLIVSNATLQWVDGHLELLPRWAAALRPGGSLAFQVPGNFASPSHTLLAELCAGPRWAALLGGAGRRAGVHRPDEYLEVLADTGCAVDVWETTYSTLLPGADPVLEWVKGTALRPALALLTDRTERAAFLAEYAALLREAYPAGRHGTVFPFRRIFAVATRGAQKS